MDVLSSGIAATCPAAYSGHSGAIFVHAVNALLAAHCTFADGLDWPKDRSDDVWRRAQDGASSYDFVIVGAGTAGAHLASKLVRQFPSKSIILIEAGGDPDFDSEIPGLLFASHITDIDWAHETQASKYNCLGYKDGKCLWSKGKTMGGSSSINGMLYTRGHPDDYSNWYNDGNPGWDYESVKRHFESIEDLLQFNNIENNEINPFYQFLTESYSEIGLHVNADNNREAKAGVGKTKLLIRDGKRLNTAKLVLNAVKDDDNLIVMKNTRVQRILIDPATKIATGVELRESNGNIMEIHANNEVILSAGSIGTPQLLMLSGIGPESHLSDIGIKTVIDLPVGKNLQDHTFLGIFLEIGEQFSTSIPPKLFTSLILQYMLYRTGPLSTLCITDFMSFVNLDDDINPDIQFHHTHFARNDGFILKLYHNNIRLDDEISNLIIERNKDHELLGLYPTLLHPKSRGEILLRDANPSSELIIKPNYFSDEGDLDVMLRSVDLVQKLVNTTTFKSLNIKLHRLNIKACGDFPSNSKQYWECYIRHISTTVYHPVGTAKMGPATDKSTVVDSHLNVHSVKRLRIVDASVMPSIPGGNTMAATLMIAEKAAEIIKTHYIEREEL